MFLKFRLLQLGQVHSLKELILIDKFVITELINFSRQLIKMKYRRCKPNKRIYRNLALAIITFLVLATVIPVMGSSGIS